MTVCLISVCLCLCLFACVCLSVRLSAVCVVEQVCDGMRGLVFLRYNLSHLEQWLRDHKMQETGGVQMALDPIVQASQLLQARKTDNDIDSICDMCSRLTTSQVLPFIQSIVQSFIHSINYLFIQSINHSINYSINYSFNHSFNYSIIQLFIQSFIQSFIQLFN